MKIDVRKSISGWVPADSRAESYHKKFKIGDLYSLEFKHYKDQRSIQHLKLYWVMLQKVVDNTDKYRTSVDLHHDIKYALDYTEIAFDVRTGAMIKRVKSIAFDKMNQEQFDKYYSDAVNIITQYIIPGLDKEELAIEIIQQFG